MTQPILTALRGVRWQLNVACVVALGLYLLVKFKLQFIPNPWQIRTAPQWGEFASDVCLAYITSWMFFFLSDQWDRTERKLQMQFPIATRLGPILLSALYFFKQWHSSLSHETTSGKYKRLVDCSSEEAYEQLWTIYLHERDTAQGHKPFSDLLRMWRFHYEEQQDSLTYLLAHFREYDIQLSLALEMIQHAEFATRQVDTLLDYSMVEEEVRRFQRQTGEVDELAVRGASDFNKAKDLRSFALHLGTYSSAVRQLLDVAKRMETSPRELLEPLVRGIEENR